MIEILSAFLGVLLLGGLAAGSVWLIFTLSGGDSSGAPVASAVTPLVAKHKPMIPTGAVVRCKGFGPDIAKERFLYDGLDSCRLANQTAGGFKVCTVGCLSLGDCARVCEAGALTMEEGAPVVDLSMCTACGQCVDACPRHIIALVSMQPQYKVSCIAHDNKNIDSPDCLVACTGCENCVKVCQYEAISTHEHLAVIDPKACVACGACAKVCPNHCIDYVDTTVTL